ncbi:MAG: DUF1592 domain-containing protein [Acidobacteria bacterium]|nr:DUF1592 domain-containing protein [Acidobacteriota bacterium]
MTTQRGLATGAAWLLALAPTALWAAPKPAPAEARSFLDARCVACHGASNPQAGLDLSAAGFDLEDPANLERWVRIHDRVRDGEMPPAAVGTLSDADKQPFLDTVAARIVEHEQARDAAQGRSTLRRLNRYEYENTLRELLATPWLELRGSLPEDGIVRRFNKVGRALDVSHVQMARYLDTADKAMRLTLDAYLRPSTTRRYYARDQKRFIGRMRYSSFNRHPERASIPVLGFEAQPDVLAETVPISVGEADPETREHEAYAFTASTYTGNEYHFDEFTAPVGGAYKLRFSAYSLWVHTLWNNNNSKDRAPWWHPDRERTAKGRTVEPVTIYAMSPGGQKRLLGSFDVSPEPAVHELEAYLLPGEQIRPDAARLFRSRPGFIGSPEATEEGMPGVAYRWMEVEGPRPSEEGYRRLFGELPATRTESGELAVKSTSEGDAERLLRAFLGRAYRRPVREDEVRRYLSIVQSRLESGRSSFQEALLAGYTAALCSPGFLYLEEWPGRLDSHALASRLSYFLWNSPPDAELRALADEGALEKPEVLRKQAARLLADPRTERFLNAFLDYWLDLRKLGDTTPDQTLYPDYYLDDLLLESALRETQLFVGELLRRDLPAANLIDSDFTFLNQRLARHYGVPGVNGVAMRAVELPADSVRGGLLTQAGVLKITANGTTTSPVLRGTWILERLLGQPPPPPPPAIPAIEPDTRGATTIREQLEKHRSTASCAVCHRKIDPPGFALEAFDVLGGFRGRYRSTEEGEPVEGIGKNGHVFTFRASQPVDASGELDDGRRFDDVRGLKELLLDDERQIARNLVEQLIVYATGEPASFADRAEVERLVSSVEPSGYGVRSIVSAVVESELFRRK